MTTWHFLSMSVYVNTVTAKINWHHFSNQQTKPQYKPIKSCYANALLRNIIFNLDIYATFASYNMYCRSYLFSDYSENINNSHLWELDDRILQNNFLTTFYSLSCCHFECFHRSGVSTCRPSWGSQLPCKIKPLFLGDWKDWSHLIFCPQCLYSH